MSYLGSRRLSIPRAARRRSSSSSSLPRWTVESVLEFSPECGHAECRRARQITEESRQRLMRNEQNRLHTFHQWPAFSQVCPVELARAGFFYLGPGDKVQCFSCGGVLKSWAFGEKPMEEHRKFFPACPFLAGREGSSSRPRSRSPDCIDGQILGQLQRMATVDTPLPEQAAHPDMELEWTRLSTFRYWPSYVDVQPQQLARAGFFYTGNRDYVKCFFCDGGLRDWEEDDDPWTEHARWFPKCAFLQQSLGPDYIRRVQEHAFGSTQPLSDERRLWTRSTMPLAVPATVNRRTEAMPSHSKDAGTAEEQLRQLQEERVCKVCMDHQVSIAFVPCGHLVVCLECAPGLTECPICRAHIRGSIRTFMS